MNGWLPYVKRWRFRQQRTGDRGPVLAWTYTKTKCSSLPPAGDLFQTGQRVPPCSTSPSTSTASWAANNGRSQGKRQERTVLKQDNWTAAWPAVEIMDVQYTDARAGLAEHRHHFQARTKDTAGAWAPTEMAAPPARLRQGDIGTSGREPVYEYGEGTDDMRLIHRLGLRWWRTYCQSIARLKTPVGVNDIVTMRTRNSRNGGDHAETTSCTAAPKARTRQAAARPKRPPPKRTCSSSTRNSKGLDSSWQRTAANPIYRR